jgi:TPR repeat protein
VAADQVRALCQREGPTSCAKLARYYGGLNEAPDERLLADLWRAACDGGLEIACVELAERYASGTGVPRDERRAVELREQVGAAARKRGDPCGGDPMCFQVRRVGPAAEKGEQIAVEREQVAAPPEAPVCTQKPCWTARTFATALEHCDYGEALSCWQIHLAYEGGHGVPADPAKAAEYEQLAVRARAARQK